jgi:hypothetical protein
MHIRIDAGSARSAILWRLSAERAANLGDEHSQAGVGDERPGPQVVVKLCLGERAGSRLDQPYEQIECLWRQVHLAPAPQELPGVLVQNERIEPKRHAASSARN